MATDPMEIASAFLARYPALTEAQAAELADVAVERMADVIERGGAVGTITELDGGDIELTLYRIEEGSR